MNILKLNQKKSKFKSLEKNYKNYFTTKKSINIAIIGKYVDLKDAYKSLDEALTHGGIDNNLKVNLIRIDSENLKFLKLKKS